MDPGQTFWAAPSPPYIQTIFYFVSSKFLIITFLRLFLFQLTWDPMGAKKIQNAVPLQFLIKNLNRKLKLLWHFEILTWEAMGKS